MATIYHLSTDEAHGEDEVASAAAYAAAKAKYDRENTDGLTWDDLSRRDKLPLYQAAWAALKQQAPE